MYLLMASCVLFLQIVFEKLLLIWQLLSVALLVCLTMCWPLLSFAQLRTNWGFSWHWVSKKITQERLDCLEKEQRIARFKNLFVYVCISEKNLISSYFWFPQCFILYYKIQKVIFHTQKEK